MAETIAIPSMDRNEARNRIANAIADVRDEDGGLEYLSLSVRNAMAERAIGYLTGEVRMVTN